MLREVHLCTAGTPVNNFLCLPDARKRKLDEAHYAYFQAAAAESIAKKKLIEVKEKYYEDQLEVGRLQKRKMELEILQYETVLGQYVSILQQEVDAEQAKQ